MNIGLFYGSSTCYTEMAAEKIRDIIGPELVTLHNLKDDAVALMEQYDVLILGIPTWDFGEIQEDWEAIWDQLDSVNLDGKIIAMYGMGAIGSLMLQLIRLTGAAKIIVIEREEEKRRLALELGATMAISDQEIEEVAKQENIDYVIECIGLKSTMEQAIRIAGKYAKVLLFGLGDPEQPISFNQFEAYTKELSIYTSFLNPLCSERAVHLLESGQINTKKIISAKLTLEEMGEELKTLRYARKGKVLVSVSGEH